MGERKKHPKPLTIDEQIVNLKSIGLIIKDEEYAKKILNDISYFRLIKAYSLNLKPKNQNYNEEVTFEHIVELYLFNANFRQILFAQIEIIEVNARCRISNFFAEELRRNAKAPFVKNFQDNYEGGDLPIYALVEIFSFGTLSKFYKNMKNEDKKRVAKDFGIGYKYLESWLESISYVRNICAHYGRLYNAKLSKTPMLYREYSDLGIGNNRIFGVLLCMKQLLKANRHWNMFIDEIELLLEKYERIDIKTMGFPDNWKEILICR